jgi:hypothetical protein
MNTGRPSLPARLLIYLPGLVALGLAVLYAIGALAKTAEIGGSGFSTPTILQLTPIQQLLALGVSNVASAESVVGISLVALTVGMGSWFVERAETKLTKVHADYQIPDQKIQARYRWAASVARERGERLALPSPRWHHRLRDTAWKVSGPVMLLMFAGLILIFRPLPVAMGFVMCPVFLWSRRIPIRPGFRAAAVLFMSFVVFVIAHGFIYPGPLPQATARTSTGPVTGDLLVSTEVATTIGLPNCHIVTIPASQIHSVTISVAPSPPHPRTIGDILFGLDQRKEHRHRDGACGYP